MKRLQNIFYIMKESFANASTVFDWQSNEMIRWVELSVRCFWVFVGRRFGHSFRFFFRFNESSDGSYFLNILCTVFRNREVFSG